jgi:hypothetical protein
LIDKGAFNGYNCTDEFCNFLFSGVNNGYTVMAHNGAGYDNKFILKWCLSKGLKPDTYIRQGSKIAYMTFRKCKIRFVDTLNFFQCRLKDLSKTYSIDTLKGHFPHHFNTPENQNYIGCIPAEEHFGTFTMSPDDYKKDFLPWYKEQANVTDWNFKEELIKYCRADVELLSKAVLKFSKLFLEKLDVDPFQYITLPSLCMSIYRNMFMPDKTIVGNSADKNVSIISKEWLLYLNDENLIPEQPICLTEVVEGKQIKHTFTVDALNKKKKIIKEFNGCYWHGCPKCHPENKIKYEETQHRKKLLEKEGYRVDEMWECEWNKIKETLPNRAELEQTAKDQHIDIRAALFGGRTEAFKSYHICK